MLVAFKAGVKALKFSLVPSALPAAGAISSKTTAATSKILDATRNHGRSFLADAGWSKHHTKL
jgi:hypothetical protein